LLKKGANIMMPERRNRTIVKATISVVERKMGAMYPFISSTCTVQREALR